MYNHYQKLMGVASTPNQEIKELQDKFEDRNTLWTHISKVTVYYEEWFKGNFLNLDSEFIEKEMKTFQTTSLKLK